VEGGIREATRASGQRERAKELGQSNKGQSVTLEMGAWFIPFLVKKILQSPLPTTTTTTVEA
jgi:hypothetical protein